MVLEKEKRLIDYLKIVSPGTPLRNVIDDLLRAGLGALIVFYNPDLVRARMFEGGFRINAKFTQQKLFELCKMDGAIIISPDLKRIIQANTLMTPDASILTGETGTRHKAAERTAKQVNTFVIAVSERKKKITLYLGSSKYFLKGADELIRDTSSTLNVLEKQRETLEEQKGNLGILEMSKLVSVSDVCKVVQRTQMILKISNSVKRNFTELGRIGNIMHMRYLELIRGVEKTEESVLRDYAALPMKRAKTLLENLTFDGLLDLESIARLILEKGLEEEVSPKGYRFLSHLILSPREVSVVVRAFSNLNNILYVEVVDLEKVLKNRAGTIYEEIQNLREQILSGKAVY